MEQFVLGIFQEQLSKFIIGFRKEQVNANLLNGKGEIRDVNINCAVLNQDLRKMTPFVELESVHVSKLSFHVSSWTNIRKAPILVHVEHLTAIVNEPLDYVDRENRRSIQQITRGEFVEMLRTGVFKARGAYNLFDRILDNLTVEIASINVSLQPWGRFKTRRPGPWMPPEIQLAFAGIRLASVNEFGQEAPPEEVWRHNHHRSASGSLLIYKKLSMEYKISIRPFNAKEPIPLVTGRDNKMEIQLAMKRRIRDGEWLAIQVDTTIPQVEADLPQEVIPHLVHTLAGISYCIAKDRSFEDPLKASSDTEHDHHDAVHGPVIKVASSDNILEENEEEDVDPSEVPLEIEEDESSSSDEDESGPSVSQGQSQSTTNPPKTSSTGGRYTMPNDVQNQPIILLPNGLTISEKFSMSIAVYDFKLKGRYAESGHFELISKGCIGEAIWPKTSREKGGYVQASVSYLTLQEKFGEKLCTLVSGGVKYDSSLPVETPGKPLADRGNDETFPLYEDRVIRPDPLGLRYSFPAQAIGLKSTIEFVQKLTEDSSGEDEEIRVIHESGIDDFGIVLDSDPWSRIIRFLANEAAGGFDSRWSSGDWSKELAPSMLARPSHKLNLEECLQPTKQIFLDENQFISSDLFNATCRLTKVSMRIPAAIQESLTASALIFRMDEGMLVVSSALPRTMLSGRIGNSVNGDDVKTKGMIVFPNDTSDVAYQLERSEDPGDRQRGILTSRAISTFRLQFTARGASAQIVPTVEFYSAKEPRELLAPTDVTMIFCFEGEPPESEESNLTKIVVFTSILAHKVSCSVDAELIASAIISLMSHYHVLENCVQSITATLAESFVDESETEASLQEEGDAGRLPRSIRGRRLRVRRQIMRSRQTGGLSIAVGMQVAEFNLSVWRQCVPTISSLRPPKQTESSSIGYVPLLKLADVAAGGFEIGVEASFRKSDRRVVLKGCLSRMSVAVCDIHRAMEAYEYTTSGASISGEAKTDADIYHLLELFSVGEERYSTPTNPLDYSVAFRIEEDSQKFSSWSLSSDIRGTCRLTFRPEELESIATLLFEALMQPSRLNLHKEKEDEENSTMFPRNSVGESIVSLFPSNIMPSNGWAISEVLASMSKMQGPIPARSLDAILRKLIEKVPERVRTVLVRTSLRDFGMFVPPDSDPSNEDEKGFCLVIHSLDFHAQYLHVDSAMTDSPLLDVAAALDKTWKDLIKECAGFFHEMKSEQSLSVAWEDLSQGGIVVTEDIVVPKFATGYSYADSRVLMEMPLGIAVDAIEHLDRFVFCMLDFRDRCLRTVVSMSNILKTLRVSSQQNEDDAFTSKTYVNPIALACLRTSSTLQSGLKMFDAMCSNLKQYDEQVTLLLKEKEEVADRARLVAFMREKERLAAYALVATQKTGWLCIGVASKTGQRSTFISSLWPHWCSLRKGILVCYSAPGKLEPLNMVPLEGASLVQLGGGNRKKDLRRAFGLIDSAGSLHILIAGSDSDYFQWIHEMKRSILALGGNSDQWSARLQGEDGSVDGLSDDGEESAAPSQQRLLGRTLSKAVQVAKASKQAVVDRRMRRAELKTDVPDLVKSIPSELPNNQGPRSSPNPTEMNEANDPSNQTDGTEDHTPNRRQQLRGKFVGMGQVTKRGLGSAMQIARQKGKAVAEKGREVAERRRQRHLNEIGVSESHSTNANVNDSFEISHGTNNSSALSSETKDSILPERTEQTHSLPFEQTVEESQVPDESQLLPGIPPDDTSRMSVRERLGNVVKNVRQHSSDPSSVPDRTGGGRFARLRRSAARPNDSEEHSGALEPITLRRVTVEGELVDSIHPFGDRHLELAESPQKRLEKPYFVRVELVDSAHPESGSDEVANSECLETDATEADRQNTNKDISVESSNGEDTEVPALGSISPLTQEIHVTIQTFQRVTTENQEWMEQPYSTTTVPVSAIFALHTEISECISQISPLPCIPTKGQRNQVGGFSQSLSSTLGLSSLDTVRITGTLLSGLLQYHPETGYYTLRKLSAYHGEIISEFFNAILDCELPVVVVDKIAKFLNVTDSSFVNDNKSTLDLVLRESESPLPTAVAQEVFSQSKVCRTELFRAIAYTEKVEKIANSCMDEIQSYNKSTQLTSLEPFTPPAFSQRLQESMYSALMKAMEERDMSHAKLAAAEVLHVHELEQQRKLNTRLHAEVEVLRMEKTSSDSDQEKRLHHQIQMQQNSDDELMSLCQQLAGEISARTSASLEVDRLKEGRQIDLEQHQNEIRALQEEIASLRKALDEERAETKSVKSELSRWRRSYEDMVEEKLPAST